MARSTQIAVETENIGTGVLGELNEQGEKLRTANVRVSLLILLTLIFLLVNHFIFLSWTIQMQLCQRAVV